VFEQTAHTGMVIELGRRCLKKLVLGLGRAQDLFQQVLEVGVLDAADQALQLVDQFLSPPARGRHVLRQVFQLVGDDVVHPDLQGAPILLHLAAHRRPFAHDELLRHPCRHTPIAGLNIACLIA
jgi:hypothetical protein